MKIKDREEIVRYHDNNPQILVDNLVLLEFEEMKDSLAIMVDAIAAGTQFDGIKFVKGPYVGKTLYCEYLRNGQWKYEINVNSDGMLFNVDVLKIDNAEVDYEGNGDFVPELNGQLLTLK